jgi:predicted DsbA family dithiol-disulfide isomerase
MTLKLAYCDYIADRIHGLVDREIGDNETLMACVDQVRLDLHPTEGYFQSTKKVMTVHDVNGKAYVITVEEAPFLDKD